MKTLKNLVLSASLLSLTGCITPAGQAFVNRLGETAAHEFVAQSIAYELNPPAQNNVTQENNQQQIIDQGNQQVQQQYSQPQETQQQRNNIDQRTVPIREYPGRDLRVEIIYYIGDLLDIMNTRGTKAMINGKVVRVGDKIEDKEIKEITIPYILLNYKQEYYKLIERRTYRIIEDK